MMFELIMNMPVRASNAPVHRIVCQHKATSLRDFTMALQETDFLIVEEFYPEPHSSTYTSHGPLALNHRYIGKIKEWSR